MADENTKTCPRDCTRCTAMQQLLCGAQFSRMNAERMDNHEERLERIEDKLKKLLDDDSGVFNPVSDEQA